MVVEEKQIRVICVDDHHLVLDGLRLIIQRYSDLSVVATATNGQEAVRMHRRHRPDVTLMDLRLPVMGGLEAIRHIRRESPSAKIVVLTTYYGDEDIYQALDAGAVGYLLKDTLSRDLIDAIRNAYAGTQTLSTDIKDRLAARATTRTLSRREVEVVRLISEGLRNKEIATVLGIRTDTIHGYIKSIFVKLDVNDRTAAVNVALRRGIIHVGEDSSS